MDILILEVSMSSMEHTVALSNEALSSVVKLLISYVLASNVNLSVNGFDDDCVSVAMLLDLQQIGSACNRLVQVRGEVK